MTDAVPTLRLATDADVDFLTDCVVVTTRLQGRWPEDADEAGYRAGFADWTREQVRGLVPGSTTWVVEVAGQRAGRLRVVHAEDHHELGGLQLMPAYQGDGLGTRLVEDFVAGARAASVRARLRVELDNPRARALYHRLGFVEVGRTEEEAELEWRPPRP